MAINVNTYIAWRFLTSSSKYQTNTYTIWKIFNEEAIIQDCRIPLLGLTFGLCYCAMVSKWYIQKQIKTTNFLFNIYILNNYIASLHSNYFWKMKLKLFEIRLNEYFVYFILFICEITHFEYKPRNIAHTSYKITKNNDYLHNFFF